MKPILFLLLPILITNASTAQMNLVPNSSFEDTVYCPPGSNQLNACKHWLNFGNTPDYFNACTPYSLPNSNPGFQYAHTGNAYTGAIFFRRTNLATGPNYREPMGVELLSPLTVGIKYYVSFFAVNAEVNFGSIACDKLGVNFYTNVFGTCCQPPLTNTAKVYTDSILTDTLNWTKISGSFIADSAYQYLCISNFFNDVNTDTLATSPFPTEAYYYIDDVCVSTDSVYNQTWTGINQTDNTHNSISIFPNPSKGSFTVDSPISIDSYSLFNLNGQLIDENKIVSSLSVQFDLTTHPIGIYVLHIISKESINTYKIILTN